MTGDSADFSFRPMTPPVEQGPLSVTRPPTVWPTVLGVIAIVFGAGGTLSNTCGTVANLFMPFILGSMAKVAGPGGSVVEAQVRMSQHYAMFMVIGSLASLAVAVMLLIGGIGLLKRKARSVRILKIWAIVRLLVAIPLSILGHRIGTEMFVAMEQAAAQSSKGAPMPLWFPGFLSSMGALGVVIGFMWAAALPVFMLIWFSRKAIKAEVAGWSDAPPPAR